MRYAITYRNVETEDIELVTVIGMTMVDAIQLFLRSEAGRYAILLSVVKVS